MKITFSTSASTNVTAADTPDNAEDTKKQTPWDEYV
jgi:hypothetical protein